MYHPVRDSRFEYVWDAIEHIEERNCSKGCVFAVAATEEYPGQGCELITKIMFEEDVEEIDDRGYELFCTKRKTPVPPNQLGLFNES